MAEETRGKMCRSRLLAACMAQRIAVAACIAFSACAGGGLSEAPPYATLASDVASALRRSVPKTEAGQSRTLLTGGEWLLLGGNTAEGVVSTASFLDRNGELLRVLPNGMIHPRAGHTATLLADGTVLILGGIGLDGKIVTSPEIFDPEKLSFVPRTNLTLTPRAYHSATMLSDGTILIAAGRSPTDEALASGEVLDPSSGTTRAVPSALEAPRFDHFAALLPSGTVLFWGGVRAMGGSQIETAEVYDSTSGRFARFDETQRSRLNTDLAAPAPSVSGTRPQDKANGVDTRGILSVRFSEFMDPATFGEGSVTLLGPKGTVPALAIPAEDGRMVLVTPRQELAPASFHTLFLKGPKADDGKELPFFAFEFKTSSAGTAPGGPASTPNAGSTHSVPRPVLGPSPENGLVAKPTWLQTRRPSFDSELWVPTSKNFGGNWLTDSFPTNKGPTFPAGMEIARSSVAGRVLHLDGTPFEGITLGVGVVTVLTDSEGRFLIRDLPPGGQVLEIDGRSANRVGVSYGRYFVHVDIKPYETTVLPYDIWMAKLDPLGTVTIPSPTVEETVVSTSSIPGLELHLPAGVIIRDHENNIVTELNLTAIPVNQPPFPLPNFQVPVYFTIQPGGATIQGLTPDFKGARLFYPNYRGEVAGARGVFWNYDAPEKGWYAYGLGTVGPDRRQLIPNPGVVIYDLSGAMINHDPPPPDPNPPCTGDCCGSAGSGGGGGGGGGQTDNSQEDCNNKNPTQGPASCSGGGDPVDLMSGQFTRVETDLEVADVFPIRLSRTYRSFDLNQREFGVGMTLSYGVFQYSSNQYQTDAVIMPNGTQVPYTRTSPGTGYAAAVFGTVAPGEWAGSHIQWDTSTPFLGGPQEGGWLLFFRDGRIWRFGENAPIQWMKDRNGNKLTFVRPLPTSPITEIDTPNGRWVKFTLDISNRITQARDNAGRTVSYAYDVNGRLTTVTDVNGNPRTYVWDTNNRLYKVQDPGANILVQTTYDDAGKVQTQTFPDTTTMSLSYTLNPDSGAPVSTELTDRVSHIRHVDLNDAGYISNSTFPKGTSDETSSGFVMDPITNNVTSQTDAIGNTASFTYDARGNRASITFPSNLADAGVTTMTYTSDFNQISTSTDPLGHTTTYTYDTSGNLLSISDPLGHATTMTYDNQGRTLSVSDALGHTHTYTYSGPDMVSSTDPVGNVTTYHYDAVGRLTSRSEPMGATALTLYAPDGGFTITTDALGQAVKETYDIRGNLASVTDPMSNKTVFGYDSMNRETSRQDPLGNSETFAYEVNGLLKTQIDRRGQTRQNTYDTMNRLSTVTFKQPDGGTESTIAKTYDALSRVTQIVDSKSGTITRTYDAWGRILTEATHIGTVTNTFDAAGRRTSMTTTGATTISYTYDNADRLTTITRGGDTITFGYDNANRRTSVSMPEGINVSYTYDADDRLTHAVYQDGMSSIGDLAYGYDATGRLVAKGGTLATVVLPSSVSSATYNANNQLTLWGTQGFVYDLNGGLTWDGTNNIAWDARNHMVLFTPDGGVASTFLYDPLGRRQEKVISGTDREYLWDVNGNPLSELVSDGGTVSTVEIEGVLDELVCRYTLTGGKGILFGATDINGSVVGLINDAGAIQASFAYEPYGKASGTGSAPASNSQRFAGREDDMSGLTYNRARYYMPSIGRFINEDPIGLAGGPNVYAYAMLNPITNRDPSGNQYEDSASSTCKKKAIKDCPKECAWQKVKDKFNKRCDDPFLRCVDQCLVDSGCEPGNKY